MPKNKTKKSMVEEHDKITWKLKKNPEHFLIYTHTIYDKSTVFSGASENCGSLWFDLLGTQNDLRMEWPICFTGVFCEKISICSTFHIIVIQTIPVCDCDCDCLDRESLYFKTLPRIPISQTIWCDDDEPIVSEACLT